MYCPLVSHCMRRCVSASRKSHPVFTIYTSIGFSGLLRLGEKSIAFGDELWYTYFAASYNLRSARFLILFWVLGGVCVCLLCPDLVRSSWDLVLVPFCLPPRIRENWASKPSCSLQCRAGKQTRQMPNQKGHSPKRNHQRGRPATKKVRSKTKILGTEKKSDQILEDIIVAFALAKPQESLSKSSCRVALSFDFWGMVQLAFHGVLQILDFSFYKVEHEIIGVP